VAWDLGEFVRRFPRPSRSPLRGAPRCACGRGGGREKGRATPRSARPSVGTALLTQYLTSYTAIALLEWGCVAMVVAAGLVLCWVFLRLDREWHPECYEPDDPAQTTKAPAARRRPGLRRFFLFS
jgi:hypothetical protein